jgi:16S rRNA (guanine527-N7)-methyltransferase
LARADGTGTEPVITPDWDHLRVWAAAEAGLQLTQAHIDRLRGYLELLMQWNDKIALVSARADVRRMIDHHIADGLFAAAHCGEAESVVDLGSGNGVPGLVIAIVHGAARVCLIESRGKKASFLETVARTLGTRNVRVENDRIEAVGVDPRHHRSYDIATARALASTELFLTLAQPLLAPGGRALAMRSPGERAGAPDAAQQIAYTLPDGTPRRLLIFS